MHEQSETVQDAEGKWVNVYGENTPKAGQRLPDSPTYNTVDEAVAAAKARSHSYGRPPMNGVTQDTLRLAGMDPFASQMTGLNTRRAELGKRSEALTGQQQDVQEQQGMLVAARGDESAPVRAQLAEKLKQAPSTDSKEERVPNFERPTIDPKEMQQSFAMLMAASMLVGVASRTPFHNTMAAMTGAMNGFMKQDAVAVKDALATFDRNVTAIKERNGAKRHEVEAAWKKHQNDLGALKGELELIAAKYDDPMALMAARSKSITEAQKLIETNIRSVDSTMERLTRDYTNAQLKLQGMEQTAELRKQTLAIQQQRVDQQGGATAKEIDPKTVDFYAAQSIAGDNAWQVGLARGKAGQKLIEAVKDRIPAMAAELGLTPQDVGTNKAANAALTKTIADRQKFLGAVGQFVRNFDSQIALVEQYTEKGASDLNQALNKWIQNGRIALQNDPSDVVRLDVAIRGAAREHQRIVTGVTSNAQLHVAAQETADQLLNRAQTPAAIKASLGVMKEESRNAVKSGEQELASLKDQMRNLGKRPDPTPAPQTRRAADRTFASQDDAAAAAARGEIKKGDRVKIGEQSGTWQ